MSLDYDDFKEVLIPLAENLADRFETANIKGVSGEKHINMMYEVVGRLKELERLCHNYAEYIMKHDL